MTKSHYHIIPILFIILLSKTIQANGQMYRGRVITEEGKPMRGATVINKTQLSADYTDPDGYFCITATIGDSLIVSNHYEDKKIVFSKTVSDIVFPIKYVRSRPNVDEEVISQINLLYLSERYKDCVALCMYYDSNSSMMYSTEKHPLDHSRLFYNGQGRDYLDLVIVYYYGALSAYQCSLTCEYTDGLIIFQGLEWSLACSNTLNEHLINCFRYPTDISAWKSEYFQKILSYGKMGKDATKLGLHFLKALEEDRFAKKMEKVLTKRYNNISKILYENTINKEGNYHDIPDLALEMSSIQFEYMVNNKKFDAFEEVYSKYYEGIVTLIKKQYYGKGNSYAILASKAISNLSKTMYNILIDKTLRKKVGANFERLCMEEMVKLSDISYHINGSSKYSLTTDYTLKDIQDKMKDDECLIFHFEAPVTSGMLYLRYDLGTRYRNYALTLEKSQERPTLWHRGFVDNSKVNDFTTIKQSHPNIHRFYCVGTPRMSFIDIAGKDSSIVRLHSFSQLLTNKSAPAFNEITFIGDINYSITGDLSSFSSKKGGTSYSRLTGPAQELEYLNSTYNSIRSIRGDDATRNIVMSEISRNKGIIHISTHGTTDIDPKEDISEEDLILKENVLNGCRLILSGYNDNPDSPLGYISGSDVLKLGKIESSLVYLDACSSGNGAVGIAGSIGIAESFHLVGAQNVICYLESVDDSIATSFSNLFYSALLKGSTCHDAFFYAKNSIKQDLKVILWE